MAVRRFWRRHPAWAAALIYALLAVAFLGPGLLPGKTLSNSDVLWFDPPWLSSKPAQLTRPSNTELGDATQYLQPFVRDVSARFPHVPLWNPDLASGRPYLANLQSGVFSPFNLPAYVLPFWTALGWIAVLKLWLAALGTYLLARALGMRFAGALLAGTVFALNLKSATWVIYPTLGIWALMPWMLLAADRVVRQPGPLSAAGLAALVAAQFLVGHPETSFHALLATVAFLVLRLAQHPRDGASNGAFLRRRLLAVAGALTGGAMLAALTLVPFGELLWLSADIHDRVGASIDVHLPLKDAIGLLMPDYWGRPTQTVIRPILLERALYIGALPLMLAVFALVGRRSRERLAVALFGGLWLAVALGIPPFVQVVTRLPVFSSGHNTRLVILAILAASLLAGWGLDDLTARGRALRPMSRRLLAPALALTLIPILIVGVDGGVGAGAARTAIKSLLTFSAPPATRADAAAVIRLTAMLGWLVVAGAALVLLALRLRGRLPAGRFAALAVALTCADLFRIGVGFNPAIDQADAQQPATGAIRFLQTRRPARFVSTDDVPQNVIALRFGVSEARGYDLPIVRRYDTLWRREVIGGGANVAAGFASIPLRFPAPTPRALRTLRLLGVTHILQGKAVFLGAGRLLTLDPLRAPGLRLVYGGPDARVYEIADALPRAFVVGAQQIVAGDGAALDAITAPGFDARTAVVTTTPIAGMPSGARAAPGSARIRSYAAERVVVSARARDPGVLVLSDNQYPGWNATVDGRSAAIERVDYLLRGVRIPAGQHTVEFRYEPLSWRIGWIVSLVSLVMFVAVVTVGVRRRGARPA